MWQPVSRTWLYSISNRKWDLKSAVRDYDDREREARFPKAELTAQQRGGTVIASTCAVGRMMFVLG